METPTIFSNTTSSNSYMLADTAAGFTAGTLTASRGPQNIYHGSYEPDVAREMAALNQLIEKGKPMAAPAPAVKENQMRIVKVYIADSDENLKLEQRLLYTGEEKLTDFTDQELFFEVPISELLAKHNAVRARTVDKKGSEKFGREIFLEPVRIRDLQMVVAELAVFK